MRSLEVVVRDAIDELHACRATHEQDAWWLGLSVNGEGDPGIRSEAPHFRRVVRSADNELPPFPYIAGRDHPRISISADVGQVSCSAATGYGGGAGEIRTRERGTPVTAFPVRIP